MASFFDEEACVEPLVVCSNGSYDVCDETLRWIEGHRNPIVVVACAGKYRTGKSFLLNRLAQSEPGRGFGVGNSVQACTKGLWVYKKFFPSPDGTKSLLFVDTEGIDALDANDTHDVRIFTLALLLSSAFLYNSVGAIDETAMQTLSLMARVTENVRAASGDTSVTQHMPHFFWILRDFSLQLVDRAGKEITTDEYLEEALMTSDPQKDQVRHTIRDSFEQRTLVTLPRPSTGEERTLEDRLFAITPRFKTAIETLRARLYDDVPPFTANGNVVTGRMYGELCRHLVDVVQTGAVPIMRDSWTLLASVQARDLRDDLLSAAHSRCSAMVPARRDVVQREVSIAMNDALSTFDARAMRPVDAETRASLSDRLDALCHETVARLGLDVARIASTRLDAFEAAELEAAEHTVVDCETYIARADACFTADDGRDDATTLSMWRNILYERIAGRWWPQMTSRLTVAEKERTEAWRANDDLERRVRDACESKHAAERDELTLRLEEQDKRLDDAERSRTKLVEACAFLETRITSLVAEIDDKGAATETCAQVTARDEDEDEDELLNAHHALRVKNDELEAELNQKTKELDDVRAEAVALKDRYDRATETHADVERSFNDGLEELRQREADMRAANDANRGEMQTELDRTRDELCAAKRELSETQAASARANDMFEREKKQLDEALVHSREQCEASQSRMLDVHKSHLDDLRTRDERMREQNENNIRERTEMSVENTKLSREAERMQDAIDTLKRKISDLEPSQRECKRLRHAQQEETLKLTRLETEIQTLRSQIDTISNERERLRQHNMQMEGELAVLRAEKKLSDARKSMT